MSLRDWFEGAITGQILTGDCRECQEKAEKYLAQIDRAHGEIVALQGQAAGDAVAYQRMARRARKWKRRFRNLQGWTYQSNIDGLKLERDEARAEAERHRAVRTFLEQRVQTMAAEQAHCTMNDAEVANLRKALDAMTARARGMQKVLGLACAASLAVKNPYTAQIYLDAAGEPIP